MFLYQWNWTGDTCTPPNSFSPEKSNSLISWANPKMILESPNESSLKLQHYSCMCLGLNMIEFDL